MGYGYSFFRCGKHQDHEGLHFNVICVICHVMNVCTLIKGNDYCRKYLSLYLVFIMHMLSTIHQNI